MECVLRVPCSTSNLGPGFDFLGLALGRYLTVRARPGTNCVSEVTYDDRAVASKDVADDLLLRALVEYAGMTGRSLPPLRLDAASEIPIGRGFGSSGAAVAAGLLIAQVFDRKLHRHALTDDELLALGVSIEGHPDNVTASLRGGCTLSVPVPVPVTPAGSGSTPGSAASPSTEKAATPNDATAKPPTLAVVQSQVHESLGCAIAWPKLPLFTAEARGVLPASVPFADAVENPRRLALLLEGLRSGDAELLRLGSADRLHERFRRALIPGSDEAIASALDAGASMATLSGAGSGLVAIGPRASASAFGAALAGPLDGGQWAAVEVVRTGAAVEVLN